MSATDRPKLLRVIARLNVGGPARQAVLLHEHLAASGFETVLVHGPVGAGEASLEHLLEERGLAAVKLADLGAAVRPGSDLRAFLQLLRILFTERPDIVHTHTAKAGTLGRLAALAFNATRPRIRRCLVVHTFHGNVLRGYFGPAASWAVRTTERLLARVTDRVVTISPLQRTEIVETFGIAPAERVSVVRLGLDLDRFLRIGQVKPQLKEELGMPPDAVIFGAVGRLVPIKDVATLLRALALVPASAALGVVIAGDGPERPALEALAAQLHLGGKARFLGWRHDLEYLYEGLDAVVLSSRNEGTPVALIEAMASARPVIATAVGGVPDLVADGRNGILVPPGDAPRLAEAMVRMAASPALRQEMGAAGRLAAEPYTKQHLLRALCELYRDGLRRRRGQGDGRI